MTQGNESVDPEDGTINQPDNPQGTSDTPPQGPVGETPEQKIVREELYQTRYQTEKAKHEQTKTDYEQLKSEHEEALDRLSDVGPPMQPFVNNEPVGPPEGITNDTFVNDITVAQMNDIQSRNLRSELGRYKQEEQKAQFETQLNEARVVAKDSYAKTCRRFNIDANADRDIQEELARGGITINETWPTAFARAYSKEAELRSLQNPTPASQAATEAAAVSQIQQMQNVAQPASSPTPVGAREQTWEEKEADMIAPDSVIDPSV